MDLSPTSHPNVASSARATGHFKLFADYVRKEIGVTLSDAKRSMVQTRMQRHISQLGFADFDDYLIYLFKEGGIESERADIFNAVTTNKTDFYREPPHFEHFNNEALPAAIARRRARPGPVKVWSAAASTGAEAWTIAFLMAEYARLHGAFRWAIVGTDINTSVLETARRAIYPDTVLAPVPRDVRGRWVREGSGKFTGQGRIVPELRKCVRFQKMNLLGSSAGFDTDVDIIFLRNVLIYFNEADQARVVDKMVNHLAPGGTLYLGHSEAMVMTNPLMKTVAPSVFVKPE